MSRSIRLMADYKCCPIWKEFDEGGVDEIIPDTLPLTVELKAALLNWSASYDRTLNEEYPPDSGCASPAEEEAFEVEGRRLWRELQEQLGNVYKAVWDADDLTDSPTA